MAKVCLNPVIKAEKPTYKSKSGQMTFEEKFRVNPTRLVPNVDTGHSLRLKVEKEMD